MFTTAGAILWLSINLYHEARGQGELPQIAVSQVVLNRVEQSGKSVEQVIKEPYQFSWRLNKKKRNAKPWKTDPKVFLGCSIVAVKAMAMKHVGKDVTHGATSFHETRMKQPPAWAKRMKLVARHGSFKFYRRAG
jgi:N-acetylmuramoyl-L-alanine amidase